MKTLLPLLLAAAVLPAGAFDAPNELSKAVVRDYDTHLAPLLDYLTLEVKPAARLAKELRAAGFTVKEGVGGTGVAAILKNGPGPLVRAAWFRELGAGALGEEEFQEGMGSDDFPMLVTDPYIPSLYFTLGGTAVQDIAPAKASTLCLPSHHSPLFKVEHGPVVRMGVESTVVALKDLIRKR